MKGLILAMPKSLADIAMEKSEGGREPSEGDKEEGSEDYIDACQDLIDAIKSEDPQAVGDALKAAVAMSGM